MKACEERFGRMFGTVVGLAVIVAALPARGAALDDGERPGVTINDRTDSAIPVDSTLEVPSDAGAPPFDVGNVAGGGTFSGVGADQCFNVTSVLAAVGDPGSPLVTTIMGDNTPATGPDCAGAPFSNRAVWWEAFVLTEAAIVRIDLCGTAPEQNPSYQYLMRQSTSCAASSGDPCGNRTVPVQAGRGSPYCTSDNNAWWRYNTLNPGVYLIPIYSDTATLINGRGPYQVHVTVEGFPGACCDLLTGTCTDGVAGSACNGPNQVFNPQQSCCTAECLPSGEEFARKGVEMLSRISIPAFAVGASSASDAWGYTSPSGREYALIGLSNATGIVEVTDPFNPVIVATPSHTSSFWWDGKVYNGHLYTSNENGGGMQVIDLTDVDNGIVTVRPPLTTSGLSTIHSTTLNPDSGYAYLNGTNLTPAGVHGDLVVVNLANPASPVMVATGSAAQSYVHDSLVVTYSSGPYVGREIAFCFCGGNGLRIVDVTNKAAMFRRGTLVYPTLSYCHQGWLSEDRRYLFMNDELDESNLGMSATTYVVNVENLDAPFMAYSYTNDKCNIDHDLIVDGTLVYKASYTRGLEVDDGINPLTAHGVAFFDTHPEGNTTSFNGVWGVYAGFASGVVIATDIERGLFVLNYDCNRNRIDDTDDIANLTSNDCNGNGFPDECELSGDCNGNSIPDTCEAGGDLNNNGIPDLCDCANVAAAGAEPSAVGKNRFLSLVPSNAGASTGIRVTLTNLPQFSGFNGQVRWVGPPQLSNDILGGTYQSAQLQCTPYYQDWSAVGTLHVYGAEVVPGSTYDVQMLHEFCPGAGAVESEYTSALTISTNKWGDVVSPLGGASQPNFSDVSAEVLAFQGQPTAPKKARSMLVPHVPVPGAPVNFQSVAAAVAGFQSQPYPYAGPDTCPP